MIDQRYSDSEAAKRDIPSFIEPRPPLISNPFMRPRPQKGTNLLELFDEDSEIEEPELVQVYLRMKPHHAVNNLYEVKSDRCLITSVDTATAGHGRKTQHNVSKMYTFSHIFGPEASQIEIFEKVVKDNLKKLPDGHSFTLLTYGASGSGKTFTLMGTVASPGLVPRSLEYVFRVVDAAQHPLFKPADGGAEKLNTAEQNYELQWVRRLRHVSAPLRDKYRRMSAGLCNDFTTSSIDLSNRTRHYVWVSFVEIYNEGIYDLLSSSDRSNASKLRIREDANGHVYVKDANQAFVRSASEAYDVMAAGKHQLQVAATGVHAHSSRSHCIFTITMLTETDTGVRTSCVRLCDLAGCERARHTRNTGARMAESRAINSSLHVLERCLHTLRRRQRNRPAATCVPYRESKLTRLLGAGLSGARGESVAMVVTLNPAPEYAHETKHVLQLAAVARDIQVNSTITDATPESSIVDTTDNCSVNVMKLRSDNERLHFELLQAQARNKELLAAMEEKQQEAANTMKEVVEEAKDMTRQYYEAQIKSLKSDMEEMVEDYESRLSKAATAVAGVETPSRSMQKKVSQLMTELAILEEKLTAESLARARAEEEVQHLRACIEERDEKAFEENAAANREEVMSLSESDEENDDEVDPLNESLEPTFKKEDINKSRLFNSFVTNSVRYDSTIYSYHENTEVTDDNTQNETNKSSDSLKDCGETTKDSVYVTGEDDSERLHLHRERADMAEDPKEMYNVDMETNDKLQGVRDNDVCEAKNNESNPPLPLLKEVNARSTYFVKNDEFFNDQDENQKDVNKDKSFFRGTYFVSDNNIDTEQNISETQKPSVMQDMSKVNVVDPNVETIDNVADTVAILMEKVEPNFRRDNSLAQFEQLEMAAKEYNVNLYLGKASDGFGQIKFLNEKRNYFDEISLGIVTEEQVTSPRVNKEKPRYFDSMDLNIERNSSKKVNVIFNDLNKQVDDTRSPSIVKDDVLNDYKPSTIKILLGESFTRQPDIISSVHKNSILLKKHDSIDIFEGLDSPRVNEKNTESHDIVKNAKESIKQLVLEQKSASKANAIQNMESVIPEEPSETASLPTTKLNQNYHEKEGTISKSEEIVISQNGPQTESNEDNTIEEFENIYKDITAPRPTVFDGLISQETSINYTKDDKPEETKYNLRHKSHTKALRFADKVEKEEIDEVLLESHAKCESVRSKPAKKSLRLRRKRSQTKTNDKCDQEENKLKDIVNLQKEFSDVTIDVPAPAKEVKDIASPTKPDGQQENLSPTFGIQSCPSKSITRSRRKLFTPMAEPLDEGEAPGNSGEPLYVPRPSYHRTRARRKL